MSVYDLAGSDIITFDFISIDLASDATADMRPGDADTQYAGEHDRDDITDDALAVSRQTDDIDDQPNRKAEKRGSQYDADKAERTEGGTDQNYPADQQHDTDESLEHGECRKLFSDPVVVRYTFGIVGGENHDDRENETYQETVPAKMSIYCHASTPEKLSLHYTFL